MDDRLESRRRWLIAGSSGGERAPVERSSATAERWFEPLHVQDPVAARERIAGQVAAGADVVLAPTWRTHRRALMDVGESRRAREWTEAAVRVAREGVDAGLERRDGVVEDASAEPGRDDASADRGPDDASADPQPDDGAPPIPLVREPPRVAGVLPLLDDEPEPGTGRLLPREPAAARDYDEAAGHLADADVELILVETRPGDRRSADRGRGRGPDGRADLGRGHRPDPRWRERRRRAGSVGRGRDRRRRDLFAARRREPGACGSRGRRRRGIDVGRPPRRGR